MDESDEIVLRECLQMIRSGILLGDWKRVVDGYNTLLEDNLQPPKPPQNLLQKIREQVGKTETPRSKEKEEEKPAEEKRKRERVRRESKRLPENGVVEMGGFRLNTSNDKR